MSELELFKFWEEQFTPSGDKVVLASKDEVTRAVIQDCLRGIYAIDHEVWEWLGKSLAKRYRISRDDAAHSLDLAEAEIKTIYAREQANG
jgi:hypothetical protein